MGKELYESFDEVKEVYSIAEEVIGIDVKGLCFEGTSDSLRETLNAQLATFVTNIAYLRALTLRYSIVPSYVAGHSLGEYAALVAAGVVTYEAALKLVYVRAKAMQEISTRLKGGMAAVIAHTEFIQQLKQILNNFDTVKIANINSSTQVVISGLEPQLTEVIALIKASGLRIIRLAVSGPFHTKFMEPAQEKLKEALHDAEFVDANIAIVLNVSGEPCTHAEKIKEALISQISSPVLWYESMMCLVKLGVNQFIEVGHGNVLTKLLQRDGLPATHACTYF